MVAKNKKPLTVVMGAGPGLGVSVMRMFNANGYFSVGLNRSMAKISKNELMIKQLDGADQTQTHQVVSDIIDQYGVPEVVVLNPAELIIKPFLETTLDDFEKSWRSMLLSAVNVLHAVIPHMLKEKQGTIIVSGATGGLKGGANFSAFASAKFALRGLCQSLAREYQSQGLHIVHVTLDGIIDTARSRELHSLDPSKMMQPDDIAAEYLHLVNQKPSAWTHELDLRPHCENF